MSESDEKNLLLGELSDLSLMIRRDGVILSHVGGGGVALLKPAANCGAGTRLESIWPEATAAMVKQMVRRAIASRAALEIPLKHAGRDYEARVSAKGPDRALCVIRESMPHAASSDNTSASGERQRPHMDRRGFLRRLQATLSLAVISERPASVAVIHLEGVADIARIVDSKVSEQVLNAAMLRVPYEAPAADGADSWWYLGPLSEHLLALVMESADRDAIEGCLTLICASLREPISIGDATFHLTPFSGVAILGQDASSPNNLIDQARAAATEARRSQAHHVRFFSDTLKLRSLARLDVARELRDAIANRDIRLRYVARHHLENGGLVAMLGYFRWNHPLRGEVAPSEFLGVAEATGLARLLSRTVLSGLSEDFAALSGRVGAHVRLSFGPLRHHLLHDEFVSDVREFLEVSQVPAFRLELRLAERTFNVMVPSVCKSLRDLGVQLVVDEVGRGMGSFDRLARSPIWGLQLDRAWVTALRHDEVALKVCRAGIGAATALGLEPIATGVDDEAQRDALIALGCVHGSGDLYQSTPSQAPVEAEGPGTVAPGVAAPGVAAPGVAVPGVAAPGVSKKRI